MRLNSRSVCFHILKLLRGPLDPLSYKGDVCVRLVLPRVSRLYGVELLFCFLPFRVCLLFATAQAALVDPCDAEEVASAARRLGVRVTHVLTTHHHHDHSGGNLQLKKTFPGAAPSPRRPPPQSIVVHARAGQEAVAPGSHSGDG